MSNEEVNTIIIDMYTFRYIPKEDRIKMILNYTTPEKRIDFMITRRMMIDFIKLINTHLDKNYNKVSEKLTELMSKRGIDTSSLPKQSPNPNNAKTLKTNDKILEEYNVEPHLLNKVSFQYLKGHDKSRVTFVSIDDKTLAVGVIVGDNLSKILEMIKKNIPKHWVEGMEI